MDTPTFPEILLSRNGAVAVVTLNNPARLNPISQTLQASLRQVLALIAADNTVRALVLTGAGRAFCSGADLSAMRPHGRAEGRNTAARSAEPALIRPDDASGRSLGNTSADAMHAVTNRMVSDLRALPLPVVCAVNGVAAGGGLGLALAGDVVLAARSAYFYLPFMAKLGIVPDVGSTWFYQRLLGSGRATALTLLGDKLPAEKAAAWGLVWDCLDDAALMPEAMSIARRLSTLPAHAALETRRAYEAAAGHTLDQQLAYEAERQRELIDRPEFTEGVQAFLDKRPPVFPPR